MSKQSKPNQIGTRKASYTTTQQPNQQLSKPSPNALITCPPASNPSQQSIILARGYVLSDEHGNFLLGA